MDINLKNELLSAWQNSDCMTKLTVRFQEGGTGRPYVECTQKTDSRVEFEKALQDLVNMWIPIVGKRGLALGHEHAYIRFISEHVTGIFFGVANARPKPILADRDPFRRKFTEE
ncbi:MAG: hypothetical protein IJG70_07540 [Kiritimatiellae bacterium]|nr:hypothetical protein [Kiritimatiellia bacterium]